MELPLPACLGEDLPEFAADSFEDGSDSRSLLWPLICALPPRQRAVVVLRFYQDLTERQVAEELGCSIGTVKSQGHDAVQALRRGLGAWAAAEVSAWTWMRRSARSWSHSRNGGSRRPSTSPD